MGTHDLFTRLRWAGLLLVVILPLISSATPPAPTERPPMRPALVDSDPVAGKRIDRAYGRLPLTFEENHGQTDGRVKFLSRGSGSTLFLTSTEAVIVVTKPQPHGDADGVRLSKRALVPQTPIARTAVRMELVGANRHAQATGRAELPGKVHYFIGNDPAKWRTNIATYARVEYRDIYPGVDLVYYGTQRQLEYDFVVAPGADPNRILLAFRGADRLEVDARGDLVLHTGAGVLRQRKPLIYQQADGVRREISGGYILKGAHRVGFRVAAYDASRPLVIDPVLSYSTYLGGSGGSDKGLGIAVDTAGNAYVTGATSSPDFTTTPGTFQSTLGGSFNVFVTKLNPSGSALVYSTYLGGNSSDSGVGIAIDIAGNAYLTGIAESSDFPTTPGAFQTIHVGDNNAFVTKLNPAGSALLYSTYLHGSSGKDASLGIAIDGTGNAYVTGQTGSTDFPTTPGAFQTVFGGSFFDGFVTKVNPSGSALVYSTFLGGSNIDAGDGIAVDAAGSAYVTSTSSSSDFPTTAGAFQTTSGRAYVTKLDPTGSSLVYSGRLDGIGGSGIAVDSGGHAYVTGTTISPNFPTTPGAFQPAFGGGAFDAFVTKFDPTGSSLAYSTYLGGGGNDTSAGIALDSAGNAYVTGISSSPDFPTSAGAFQAVLGGNSDVFVTQLNSTGSAVVYSTYLGGSGQDIGEAIALDGAGNAYVTGHVFTLTSTDFPSTPGAFQPAFAGGAFDGFVAKIVPNTAPGTNVSASAGNGVTVTFTGVVSQGETAATTSSTGPTPPAGFSVGGSSYYAITTTATFVPPVTICIVYDPAQFNDPVTLRMFHFENNAWVDVTTSNDPIAGRICGATTSLSPFLLGERTPLAVAIDIKPGAYPNTINLGSNGTVPVAILSTATFDARTVDPTTVTLASAPVKLTGKGKLMTSTRDVDGDGRLDLIVDVETSALQLSSTDTMAVLKGRTTSGQPIKGSDSVRVVPQ